MRTFAIPAIAGKYTFTTFLTYSTCDEHLNFHTDSPIAGAAAEAALYARYDAAFAPAMVAHDDCAELPKLCTDGVTLNGSLTILTYLCPEKTAAPSTVTVTTTATTTVTADPPANTSWSVASTVFDIAPTSFNE